MTTAEAISIGVFLFGVAISIYCLSHWKLIIKTVKEWKANLIVATGFIAVAILGITNPKFSQFAFEYGEAKFKAAQIHREIEESKEQLAAINERLRDKENQYFKPLATAIAEAESKGEDSVVFTSGAVAVKAQRLKKFGHTGVFTGLDSTMALNGWIYLNQDWLRKANAHRPINAIAVDPSSGGFEKLELPKDKEAVETYDNIFKRPEVFLEKTNN